MQGSVTDAGAMLEAPGYILWVIFQSARNLPKYRLKMLNDCKMGEVYVKTYITK